MTEFKTNDRPFDRPNKKHDDYESYVKNPAKFLPGGLILRRRFGEALVIVHLESGATTQVVAERSHSGNEVKFRVIGGEKEFRVLREEIYFK